MSDSEKNTGKIRNKDGTFAKGNQEGNRNGRPKKGNAIADILNSIGDEIIENKTTGEKITKREAVLRTIYAEALKGDLRSAQYISDRTEGKAIETVRTQEIDKDEVIIV